jgi:hypothetical protein
LLKRAIVKGGKFVIIIFHLPIFISLSCLSAHNLTNMNILARAMAFIGRIQALGVKESALRYYRSGDIHQLYGTQVGTDKSGNLYESLARPSNNKFTLTNRAYSRNEGFQLDL